MTEPRRPTLIRPVVEINSAVRPLVPPLMTSVAYGVDSPDALDEVYERGDASVYAREGHPNADVLAREVAALEGAEAGLVTGSGMAAVSAVLLALLSAGDHVIGATELYGRSLRMMNKELPRLGIEVDIVDTVDADNVGAVLKPNTKLVLIETIANPLTTLADLNGIASLLSGHPARLVVDNTFATPHGCRPLLQGADIVLHSLTKLIGGHSDVTLGWVGSDPATIAEIDGLAVTLGLTASPYDCWQASKALTSFPLRFERATQNARGLADHLARLDGVVRVMYPGRADHPQAEAVPSVLKSPGNMLAFEIAGGRSDANILAKALTRFGIAFAPTLGDVGTVVSHPASSSHRELEDSALASIGISEGTFRISVGIEDEKLLCDAFSHAIAEMRGE